MNPRVATEHDRVGPYQLVKAIGAGGSARVDLARIDRAYGFQRHVVIKRPLEHLRGDSKAADSLRREARLGGRLRHPNLVAVLDAGVHEGYDYLVLEYVHGGSLRTLMQSDDPARVREVPLEVALAIVRDVARGLHVAHELADERGAPLGLVHRDVSPANVLVGLDGAVKLADFGIAKETRVATLSGSMHGTVTYMAPEQCRGHAFDRRADVFSLGVILYELVVGQRLFWADNDVASLHRVLAGNVPRARKVKPTISPVLDDIIASAVAHDPLRRIPTACALADALEAYGAGAGAILGARHVADWVHDLLGPRDVPWIGATTLVDTVPVAPGPQAVEAAPLVDLIASTPVEEPPPPTFGPNDPNAFDDVSIDTEPRRDPEPRRARGKKRTLLVIGVGLIAGGLAAAVLVTRGEDSSAVGTARPAEPATPSAPSQAPSAPSEASSAPVTAPAPAEAEPGPEIDPNIESDVPAEATAEVEPPASHPKRPRKPRPPSAATTPPAAATPSTTPAAGSGSAGKPPRVEWDPKMLFPTDSKSSIKPK
jgi:serine/threonine-protein kinase